MNNNYVYMFEPEVLPLYDNPTAEEEKENTKLKDTLVSIESALVNNGLNINSEIYQFVDSNDNTHTIYKNHNNKLDKVKTWRDGSFIMPFDGNVSGYFIFNMNISKGFLSIPHCFEIGIRRNSIKSEYIGTINENYLFMGNDIEEETQLTVYNNVQLEEIIKDFKANGDFPPIFGEKRIRNILKELGFQTDKVKHVDIINPTFRLRDYKNTRVPLRNSL